MAPPCPLALFLYATAAHESFIPLCAAVGRLLCPSPTQALTSEVVTSHSVTSRAWRCTRTTLAAAGNVRRQARPNLTLTHSAMSTRTSSRKPRVHVWLWIVQGLLTLIFLFTGGSKLATPSHVLAEQSHLSGAFMKFIGVCEVLGALGLVLPGVTHIRPGLTPLAAALLVIIMIGATVSTAILLPSLLALPVVVLLLTAFVAYGRWRLAPLDGASSHPVDS